MSELVPDDEAYAQAEAQRDRARAEEDDRAAHEADQEIQREETTDRARKEYTAAVEEKNIVEQKHAHEDAYADRAAHEADQEIQREETTVRAREEHTAAVEEQNLKDQVEEVERMRAQQITMEQHRRTTEAEADAILAEHEAEARQEAERSRAAARAKVEEEARAAQEAQARIEFEERMQAEKIQSVLLEAQAQEEQRRANVAARPASTAVDEAARLRNEEEERLQGLKIHAVLLEGQRAEDEEYQRLQDGMADVKSDSFSDKPGSFVVGSPSAMSGRLLGEATGPEEERIRAAEQRVAVSRPVGSGFTYGFRVADPKVAASGSIVEMAHWVYQVSSSTTNPAWAKGPGKVTRRYNDFVWLRDKMMVEYPGRVVPPLPPKEAVQGTLEKVAYTNTRLIEFRTRALTMFMCAIGAHDVLSSSELLRKFCEQSEAEFESYKKTKETPGPGVLGSVLGKMKGLVGQGIAPSDQGIDPKFARYMLYLRKQRDALTVLKTYLDGLVQSRRDTHKTFSEISACMGRLGNVEAIVDGLDQCPTSRDAGSIASYAKDVASLNGEQSVKEMCLVAESVQFYGGIYASALEGIEGLRVLCGKTNALALEAKKAQALFDGCPTKSDMNGIKLEASVKHLTGLVTRSKESLTTYEQSLDVDVRAILSSRASDWKQTMTLFVDLQISLSRRIMTLEFAPITDPWS